MSGVTVKVILQDLKKVEAEALVVGFFQDIRPLKGAAGQLDWLLCGALSRLLLKNKLKGSLGDVALLTSQGKVPPQKIFMVGLGKKADFSALSLRTAAKTTSACVLGAGVTNAAVEYFQVQTVISEDSIPAFREGLEEGAGNRGLKILLIAPDEVAYSQLFQLTMSD
jgi:Cytosol aminopeptidase family, N-terminal domain